MHNRIPRQARVIVIPFGDYHSSRTQSSRVKVYVRMDGIRMGEATTLRQAALMVGVGLGIMAAAFPVAVYSGDEDWTAMGWGAVLVGMTVIVNTLALVAYDRTTKHRRHR